MPPGSAVSQISIDSDHSDPYLHGQYVALSLDLELVVLDFTILVCSL